MLLQRIFFSILSTFVFLFVTTTSVFAEWGIDLSGFTIGNTPATIDENGEFSVGVNLSVTGQAGSSYYLRAAFSHPTTPTSYFGYTKNNAGDWYNGTPTPIDHTKFYQITLDSNASWIGTISVKPDPVSSAYKDTGSYNFKVGRYTAAGSGPTWSDNSVSIKITKTQNFIFANGWNFVGLTVDKEATYSAQTFLEDFNTSMGSNKALSVTRWYSGRYQTYLLDSGASNFDIVPGEGYFVKTNSYGTASISGVTPILLSINLPTGYSMISFPRALNGISNAEQLLQAMQSQGIDTQQIMKWYAGRWLPHVLGSDANNFSIIPGEGYFLRNYGSLGTFTLP